MPSGKKRSNGKTDYSRAPQSPARAVILGIVFVALVVVLMFIVYQNATYDPASRPAETPVNTQEPGPQETPADPDATPAATAEPTPTPTPEPFEPHAVDSTEPSNYIAYTDIQVDGTTLADGEAYEDDTGIYMGYPEEYAQIPGIMCFRGNNLRSSASYGTASMTQKQFGTYWTHTTGSLMGSDGAYWSGNGWTGQPLIAEWPYETRQNMTNMHDWARSQETLVEVIYPSMDGYVYFLELETGKETRDALFIGYTFKGTGTLDPRGYPILYIGSGYDSTRGASHVFIISLIDGSIMYEFGNDDNYGFALRPWPMFDAAPLIDADTDKLIWAGENGLLYIITLGTEYDAEAGTVSINPSRTVKWRYESLRHQSTGQYWLGFEASPIVWQGYIFLADNGGHFMCLNLDTLELVWVQDILDDSNCTPVLDFEDGYPYLYISTSYHIGWRSWTTAEIPVWKIDAETGEIVWQVNYTCYSADGLSGGAQSSIALGQGSLDGLIYLSMARYPSSEGGTLLALDKETGEEVWTMNTQVYSWSTPTLVYDQDGNGYVIYCTLGQYMYLLDGLTGEQYDAINCGGKFEASPAVYNNWIVVGHRNGAIWGVQLT